MLAELPEEDEQFLVEEHLPLRVGQVRLGQRIHQKSRDALQDEVKVLLAMDAGQVVEEEVVRKERDVGGGGGGAAGRQGRRRRGRVLVQGDNEHLEGRLHQLLSGVVEEEVVVGQDASGVVPAHRVQQRREQRQRVAVLTRREVLDPPVIENDEEAAVFCD